MEENKSWVVETQENETTGELFVNLPDELLTLKGWKEGDTMLWKYDPETLCWTLQKKE